MADEIGLNHILRLDSFCFCLLCKTSIPENDNLNKENIGIAHIESGEHYINNKALFKSCFPDSSCESDDIKYVNILRNLVFDVSWEIGEEASYVCKIDNNIRCLICEESISKICEDKKKLELTLTSHLDSEIHLKKVRSKAGWIHHPYKDIFYIAFHKSSVFCSYCQKHIKSPQNLLLQTAVDHITADLEMKTRECQNDPCISSDLGISNEIKNCINRKTQKRGISIHNRDCVLSPSQKSESKFKDLSYNTKIKDFVGDLILSPSEIGEKMLQGHSINTKVIDFAGDCSISSPETSKQKFKGRSNNKKIGNFQINRALSSSHMSEVNFKGVISNKLRDFLGDFALDTKKDLYLPKSKTWKKTPPSTSTSNENAEGLQIIGVENVTSKSVSCIVNQEVIMQLFHNNSMMKLNKLYIEIKDNRFFCKMCNVFIKFDSNGNRLKTHLFSDHNDILAKRASVFISKAKNVRGNISLPNQNEESEKFSCIIREMALDKKFKPHLNFIENNGKDFVCILCRAIIPFTTCGKNVEQHFFQTYHLKKTFEISVANSLVKEQADEILKVNNKNKKCKPQTDLKTLALFFNINGLKLQPDKYQVEQSAKRITSKQESQVSVMKRRLLKVLRLTSEKNIEVKVNLQFLIIKDSNIFCTACQSLITTVTSGAPVLKHCTSEFHNQTLFKTATDYLVSNNLKPFCSEQTGSNLSLPTFYELVNAVTKTDPNGVLAPHMLFLISTDKSSTSTSWLSCHLCNVSIEFVTVGCVKDHFLSNQHRRKTYELSCKSLPDYGFNISGDQPCGFEVIESLKIKNHCQLKDSTNIDQVPQKELKSSQFECALSKILKTANHHFQGVIESNKQHFELNQTSFYCTLCKVNFPGKTINAAKLKSIAMHCNGKSHRKLKQAFEKVTTVKNKCSSNPVSQLETYDTKHSSDQRSVVSGAIVPNTQHKDGKEYNQNNDELLTLIPKNLPVELKQYENMIEFSEGKLQCKLCSFQLSLKSSLPNTFKTFQQHYLCEGNKCKKIEHLIGTEAYESVSTIVQQCINKNIDYLEMRGTDLYCCICKLTLCRRRDTACKITFSNMSQLYFHFDCKRHKNKCTMK